MKIREDFISIRLWFNDSVEYSVFENIPEEVKTVSAAIEWWNYQIDHPPYGDKVLEWVHGTNRDRTFKEISRIDIVVHTELLT